jgi:2-polyprenyl-3-methyl-5-hydroxy-6-metoxy-1,4-benzoquinol methylase
MLPRENIPCAICDSLEARPVYRKFDLTVSRCARCGLVLATPRATRDEIWGRYSPGYFWDEYLPAHGVVDGRFDLARFDAVHAPMLELIAHDAAPGRMLEVGTGAGFFMKAAERAGWNVAGIEVSQEAVVFARERLGLDVRQGSAEELRYPDGSFDLAVLFEVIEHLLDPLRALQSVRSAVKPGGRVLLSTPNFGALSRRILGRQWAVISPAEHLYYFTETSLARLLARAGFTDVRFERQYRGFDLQGTVNVGCTHEPDSRRARFLRGVVEYCGARTGWFIREFGLGDTLLCLATRPAK